MGYKNELAEANRKIEFLYQEKEKRAGELYIANLELIYQNGEKEKRADELVTANLELDFQNEEKEKRADELITANLELDFQNEEKKKRADELAIAYLELTFQNREKESKTEELILANKKLSVQKVQLEDFFNIVSHNLRGPLNNIFILVDDITESKKESEVATLKELLKGSTVILREILDELMESLQVKYDLEIRSKKIDLKDYFLKTCAGLRGEIDRSNALLECDFDESLFLHFPPTYVRSIMHNLISNSLKYKSPLRTPHICVTSKREGNKMVLSVADNGLGIDLNKHGKDLFKIRKVFHTHPDAKGFGLYITKCQMEAMKGRIWADSIPQVGSTFYVEFNNQPL
ncbi:sensor histidine kinase [Cyclobacterium salsum]|uniref:sensor histidine kinase n=1 Tax=Cyclobacterium salsum TaxID=2666329 RepID=UPI0013908A04|nr:HAMP domain-containing sensor histidine kinase [Cyclobacterium salsum]